MTATAPHHAAFSLLRSPDAVRAILPSHLLGPHRMTQHRRRPRRPQASASRYRRVPSYATSPLPSTIVEDDVAFDEGYFYVPSPDGSRMYWESPGTTASLVAERDGSQGRRLDPKGDIDYYAGGWSPDGTKIVYQRRDSSGDDFGDLVVEDVSSGRTTRITDLEQSSVDVDGWWYLSPTFSPDGRNVIYQWPQPSSSGITWALWSVPVTGGEPDLLVKNAAQATTSHGTTYAFVRPTPTFFAGSSLVINDDGTFLGSVSGGCVEGAVVTEALDVIASGQPKMLEFGVADETAWNVGLSCGGTIRVFVEKVGQS